MTGKKQTWGIALVSILIWIGAAITILGAAVSFLFGSTLTSLGLSIGLPDFSGYLTAFTWVGIIGIIMAFLYILLGFFLWKHNTYAWWIAFGLTVFGVIASIPSFLVFSPVLLMGILLAVVEIIALTNKDSMQACKIKIGSWKGW